VNISAEEQIRQVLCPTERLIWAARSRQGLGRNRDLWPAILFSLLWLALVLAAAMRNFQDLEHAMSDVVAPIGMACFGLIMFGLTAIVEPRQRRKTACLSTERALIVGGRFNRTFVSMPLEFM
jgi:hypothetical protein